MTTLTAKFDSWWKVGGILVACLTVGLSLGFSLHSLTVLPDRVQSNESGIAEATARLDALESTTARSTRDTDVRLERLECLVLAGLRDTPIEDCL
ncbi:MAG: hypothetical protein AAF170_04360 [Bacteroidota bacterium]